MLVSRDYFAELMSQIGEVVAECDDVAGSIDFKGSNLDEKSNLVNVKCEVNFDLGDGRKSAISI